MMFDVAMYLLEQPLSSTWEALLSIKLLKPQGMESTTFYGIAEDTDDVGFATVYV